MSWNPTNWFGPNWFGQWFGGSGGGPTTVDLSANLSGSGSVVADLTTLLNPVWRRRYGKYVFRCGGHLKPPKGWWGRG